MGPHSRPNRPTPGATSAQRGALRVRRFPTVRPRASCARAVRPLPMSLHASMDMFASAINLALDLTFLAQFVLFGVFVTFLKPLLFDPLLKVFEERERRTEGAKEEARQMDAEAGELLQRYEG